MNSSTREKTNQRLMLIILAVLAVIASVGFAWLFARNGANPADQAMLAQLQRIEERLNTLEVRGASGAQAMRPASGGVANPAELQQALQARAEAGREAQTRSREARRTLESEFATSKPGGSRQDKATEALLQQANAAPLAAEVGSPVSQQVECRGRICRMEFGFKDPGMAQDWADLYPVTSGAQLSEVRTFLDALPEGGTQVVLYGTLRDD